MNVHLTQELEQLVQARVKSGRYNSASEVVRDALRLLADRDELMELRKQELRKKNLPSAWTLFSAERVLMATNSLSS